MSGKLTLWLHLARFLHLHTTTGKCLSTLHCCLMGAYPEQCQ